MSLYEPVYTEGGDTLYVMDQISDKKNREENWVQDLALQDAISRLNPREKYIIRLRFLGAHPDGSGSRDWHLPGPGEPA